LLKFTKKSVNLKQASLIIGYSMSYR